MFRGLFFALAVAVMALALAPMALAESGPNCVGSARGAAEAGLRGAGLASAEVGGATYRRAGMKFDASLGATWAMVEECGHPERPLKLFAVKMPRESISGRISTSASGVASLARLMEAPAVRAGELVRLWRRDSVVRMELEARAEQAGREGDEIWLRSEAGGFTQRMRGVVRAAGSVEMLP